MPSSISRSTMPTIASSSTRRTLKALITPRPVLSENRYVIFDADRARGGTGRCPGDLSIMRRPDRSCQSDVATVGADADIFVVHQPGATQCEPNFVADVRNVDRRLYDDLVEYADNAMKPRHILGGSLFLVKPWDMAEESKPAVLDLHLNCIRRDKCVPCQAFNGGRRDVVVAARSFEWQLDRNFLGNRLHAAHPACCSFGCMLLGERPHMTSQCHHARIRCDADIFRHHAWFPA